MARMMWSRCSEGCCPNSATHGRTAERNFWQAEVADELAAYSDNN